MPLTILKAAASDIRHAFAIGLDRRRTIFRHPVFDTDLPQHFIEDAVIAALENDVPVLAGIATRDA